jgi:hypothetical protein
VSVGEVFEVMTQVDHALTLVNKFDWQLSLIKNLERHSGAAGITDRNSVWAEVTGAGRSCSGGGEMRWGSRRGRWTG